MRTTLVLVFASAVLCAAPVPAGAGIIEIDWGNAAQFERRVEIAPGKFAELCGPVAKGSTVRWWFESDVPLDFNIHFHEGRKVHYPARQDGILRADGALTAVQARDHCWMWTNKADKPAALGVRLAR